MPLPVRIATAVQFATLGLTAAGATLSVLTTAGLLEAVERATRSAGYGMDEASGTTFMTGLFSYGLITVWAAGALLVAVFAFGYRHEVERWTRVGTWALAVPVALLGLWAMFRADTPRSPHGGAEVVAETARILDQTTPDWWPPALVALQVLTAAAYLAVVVLLAAPASRAWFRRPPEDHPPKPT